jgi:hypothetical protein
MVQVCIVFVVGKLYSIALSNGIQFQEMNLVGPVGHKRKMMTWLRLFRNMTNYEEDIIGGIGRKLLVELLGGLSKGFVHGGSVVLYHNKKLSL